MEKICLNKEKVRLYSDWYVLHVKAGRERFIKEQIEKYASKPVEMTIFQREIIHTRKGNKVKITGPLFKGYIFVHKKIDEVLKIAKQFLKRESIYPICVDNKPCQVYKDEMELLLRNTNKNGTFLLSHGLKAGDKVEVTDGPLKTLQGNILWIDEKKSKAKVELYLFKRKMRVNLGVEVVGKK